MIDIYNIEYNVDNNWLDSHTSYAFILFKK